MGTKEFDMTDKNLLRERAALARQILDFGGQKAWNLLKGVALLEGLVALPLVRQALLEEIALDRGPGSPLTLEQAGTQGALALLQGEPVAPWVGKVLYWNVYLNVSVEKLDNLILMLDEELG
jgi:hypothetical protein